ncbi:MAG: hypothetical protein ACK5WY_03775 [Holosporaceae bacterium]|jgi:hypothetical protein
MQNQEIKYEIPYEISLDSIQKIAISGIVRALTFVKFAATGAYDLEKVNMPTQNEGQFLSNDFMPPIQPADFQKCKDDFVTWNLNNAVNEIIESFFVFLEISYFALDANGNRRPAKSSDNLGEVIKNWEKKVREKLRTENKIQALSDKGLKFSDDQKKIIESFWEIRNLLSHNLGIADNRKKLDVDENKIILKFYRREWIAMLRNGKERLLVSGRTLIEAHPDLSEEEIGGHFDVGIRNGIQTKEIQIDDRISFDIDEVQQIGWTFWLIVEYASAKFQEIVNTPSEKERNQ